jgi:hypothetical protein
MLAWLHLLLFLASQQNPAAPAYKVDIHIAGAVAMVEVWRSVDGAPRTVGNRQVESTVDLNLPEGAALVDWEVLDRGERARLGQQTEGQVSAGLAAALKMRQLSPSTTPVEEGTDLRIHITPLAEGTRPVLHYRFSMPAGCRGGKLVLSIPESLEENPVPAEVTLTIEPHPDGNRLAQATLAGMPAEIRPGTRRLVVRGLAPARAAWDVSWSYQGDLGTFPGQALATLAPVAKQGRDRHRPQVAVVAMACLDRATATLGVVGKEGPTRPGLPSSVMVLVDRSRSVGQGGVSAERQIALALLDALPPTVPFNAILFGETATPLFPLPRMTTRETLDAFSAAADPNRLEKVTDLVAALARARALASAWSPGSSEPSWIAIVTDGALPVGQTAEKMQQALSGKGDQGTRVLVLLVRQRGDDSVGRAELAEYARLAERFGGTVLEVPPGSAQETARSVVSSMLAGGDWFGLRFDGTKLADVLSAGQGASTVFVADGHLSAQRRLRFSARGTEPKSHREVETVRLAVKPALAKSEWVAPLVAGDSARRRAWAGATSSVALAVLPASPPPKKSGDEIVRGRLDETVLRNALALAFMPRARACYVSRRVATATDAFLQGKVRLELTIERGELHGAVVRQSTLNHPEIESCLCAAAFAVEYPRPEHRDALTVANLNLVFRPHTSQDKRPDASPLDREIELVLGPMTFTTDFKDLLEKTPADKSPKP